MVISTMRPRFDVTRWNVNNELELIKIWRSEGLYDQVVDLRDEKTVVIDTPPPYPSGKWGVAQAAHYAQIDMVARFFRMRGYRVLVPFYADRNGLPVEVAVERKFNVVASEIAKTKDGRVKFLNMCKDVLDELEKDLVSVWIRIGCSFSYWKSGTDSEQYRKLTQTTFVELWNKGLIYVSERPVSWCPRCRTSLAEAEVEFAEERAKLYYVKFYVKGSNEYVVIATSRPELIGACDAVIYNPDDNRYKHLNGKELVLPIYDRAVPVLEHSYAKPEFGTGLVMICSYGDINDVRLFRELGLTPRILINADGTMNDNAGSFLKGLTVREAKKKIVDVLNANGYIERSEEYIHEIPVCWRCKTPVEYIHMEEYFLKQLEFKDALLRLIDEMEFRPEEHKIKLINWINSISMDWPISRSRFYGTEIPVWICSKCGSKILPPPNRYYRPWAEDAPMSNCPECGAPKESLMGEVKTFDTWFDSSVSPLYITGYLSNRELSIKALSNAMRPQGYDIIRTWLYYTILRTYQLVNKPAFRWVRISGMGLDEKGEAMHKSKGNVIYPEQFIEKYGADAFRYWAAAASRLGSDYRWSEKSIKTGTLYITKLLNIARFISTFPEVSEGFKLRPLDEAMLNYLWKTAEKTIKSYENLDVYEPINELYTLTWDVFASNYIEAVKTRAYGLGNYSVEEVRAAWYVLHRTLKTILKLLAPILPFITDFIWRQLYGPKGVHTQLIDEREIQFETQYTDLMMKLVRTNSIIWKYKKENNLKFSENLDAALYIPKELELIKEELKDLHRFSEVAVGLPAEPYIKIGDMIYVKYK
ncbi:MAG: valine--tRNA ligase [Sulfolobales archaeon]|nr:valine--tRNA ligase [Sulfolobales archaeon]MCX8185968.1 valine--tRNA ligase [Sulfolobales archaeon]MDW7969225.1 valine--tRNA ligase [Sulfolobales archaeon]